MWTRRKIIGALGAAAAMPTLPRVATAGAPSRRHPLLRNVALAIWGGRSAVAREIVAAGIPGTDFTGLLARKEAECAALRDRLNLEPREIYSHINSTDFRAGRILTVRGIVLSDIDVAVLLASIEPTDGPRAHAEFY